MNIDEFKNSYQYNLIDPLARMPLAQLRLLDSIHDQSVLSFQKTIGKLYAPPGPFTGQAASRLADLLAQYYSAENGIGSYSGGGLSERVNKLIQFCQNLLADLEPQLRALQSTNPNPFNQAQTMLGSAPTETTGSQPQAPMDGGSDSGLGGLVLLCIVGTLTVWANAQQEWQLWNIYETARQWETNMSALAMQSEPPLPGDLSPFTQDVTIDMAGINGLTSQQQQEVNDIIAQLTAAGYAVDQWEVEALVRLGYHRADILGIFKILNDHTTNVYLKGIPFKSDLVDLTTAIFTYETQAATSNLRFLKAIVDNRKPGQSIRSLIPDYDQLPKSVKNWLLMKPGDPFYYTTFGTAVEDLVDQRVEQLPGFSRFAKQYDLAFNRPLPGHPNLIPDVQFRLPGGCIAVIDITSFAQVNTKQKYNVQGVCYIVVAIHGLP